MVKRNYIARITRETLIENVQSPREAFDLAERIGEDAWGVVEYYVECCACNEQYEKCDVDSEHNCEIK